MGNGKDLCRGIKKGGGQWLMHYGLKLSIRICFKSQWITYRIFHIFPPSF